MSTKNVVIWLVIIILVIGGVYYFTRGTANAPMAETAVPSVPANQSATTPTTPKTPEPAAPVLVATNMVEITANGFSPSAIKVKAGDTVTWTNKDSVPHWPATAAHPTHLTYPGSDIKKCGTAEQISIFDACKGLATGESYSFKFDQTGNWKYHDHLKAVAPFFGSVTVE